MYQHFFSTMGRLFLLMYIFTPNLPRAHTLDSVPSAADRFVDCWANGFARSMAIILAGCGFMAVAGRLPWGAALAEIPHPLFLRKRV